MPLAGQPTKEQGLLGCGEGEVQTLSGTSKVVSFLTSVSTGLQGETQDKRLAADAGEGAFPQVVPSGE